MVIELTAMIKDYEAFIEQYQDGDEKKMREGMPLLNYAIANNKPKDRYKIASLLLDKGSRVDCSNKDGHNLLHVLFSKHDLCFETDYELTKRILDRGIDFNQTDKKKRLPLHFLVASGESEEFIEKFLDLMLAYGKVCVTGKSDWGYSPMDLAEKSGRQHLVNWMKGNENCI